MLLHFPDLLVFYINIIHLVPSSLITIYAFLPFSGRVKYGESEKKKKKIISKIWRIRKKKKDYLNLSLKQRVLVWLFEKRQEFVNSVGGKSTKLVPDFLSVYVHDNSFCIWVCKISGLGRRILYCSSSLIKAGHGIHNCEKGKDSWNGHKAPMLFLHSILSLATHSALGYFSKPPTGTASQKTIFNIHSLISNPMPHESLSPYYF